MLNHLRHKYLLHGSLLWVLILLLLGASPEAQATHIRAGDITAKRDTTPNPNPRRFFFTMIIYTNHLSQAEDPEVTIYPGVGTTSIIVPRKSVTPINSETDREVFEWEYTYPSDGTYTTYWVGENRDNNILNMAAPSDQRSFFISTTIDINALRGFNSTPVLTVEPIDDAAMFRKFVHNPGAYDADGDSLSFKLVAPRYRDPSGAITVVPGYRHPDQVANCRTSDDSGPAFFRLDPITGQLTWDAPCLAGRYNIAFVVEEWRRGPNGGAVKIGEVVRDMRINVEENENRPPVLEPKDTCVVAGTTLRGIVRATDPDGDLINLTVAGSGIVPPATFEQRTNTPGSATGLFIWNTECANVRRSPYQVIFRAEDVRPQGDKRLADLQPWNITVIGPAPENLDATSADRNVTLTWDSYTCQNADKIRIYRREGPSNFVPDYCQTGVPASTGYVLIGEVDAGETTFFDDDPNLKAGVEYCYIIYATFPAPGRGESLASLEVCVVIDQDIPYLTNVTVDETSTTNGQITVKWTQPIDVEKLTPPLEYRLYRKVGMEAGNGFTEVKRTRNMADTTFVDRNLNTVENAYRYRLEFYRSPAPGGQPSLLRDSAEASSVYLSLTPAEGEAKEVALNWTYNVPWKNEVLQHYIYRQATGGEFVLIDSVSATATSGSYTDRGTFNGEELVRGQEYCYYVVTAGTYQIKGIPEPLLNYSQRVCVTLPKLICPPELSIQQLDCNVFNQNPTEPPYQNVLNWVPNITGDCTDEIAYYTVYFKPTLDAEYTPLDTTTETTYTHSGLETFAGCYVVTATDVNGRESAFSNEVCNDNCISFILPNIITPNGDNLNDVFRPKVRAFIRSMRFRVYNRWGVQVYDGGTVSQGEGRYINWPGVDNDGNRLTDGTYYYEAEVEFYTLDPAKARATYKGWVEIVR
ncbi:gliding motility-associated-like protein [Pontibacter mucosus]|uniref:Gliding motility-associated-like protein n=1 Tax=Pontibacter mucosus TaxID=1649266 RepID=A0A2T5YHD5_9BACT|nr:gliding motility-associated C-terminal domain-containing protein [Pontibacter mucosus]PTX18729.1 gliding motility-associated-like protein [Pontibacter mucosus]